MSCSLALKPRSKTYLPLDVQTTVHLNFWLYKERVLSNIRVFFSPFWQHGQFRMKVVTSFLMLFQCSFDRCSKFKVRRTPPWPNGPPCTFLIVSYIGFGSHELVWMTSVCSKVLKLRSICSGCGVRRDRASAFMLSVPLMCCTLKSKCWIAIFYLFTFSLWSTFICDSILESVRNVKCRSRRMWSSFIIL